MEMMNLTTSSLAVNGGKIIQWSVIPLDLSFGLCFQFLVSDFGFHFQLSTRVRFDLIFFGGWICCLTCERGNKECQFRVPSLWGRALNLFGGMGTTTIDRRQGEGSKGERGKGWEQINQFHTMFTVKGGAQGGKLKSFGRTCRMSCVLCHWRPLPLHGWPRCGRVNEGREMLVRAGLGFSWSWRGEGGFSWESERRERDRMAKGWSTMTVEVGGMETTTAAQRVLADGVIVSGFSLCDSLGHCCRTQ
jgi:hypothetical protein